jgi:hypothetical protein
VSATTGDDRSEKKALLAMRAELDRSRVTLAAYQIRMIVAPGPDADRAAGLRPVAAMVVRIAGPLFGAARLGRWMRVASIALGALRIVRDWK